MTRFAPIDLDQAFVPKDIPMFADLIAKLGEDNSLKSTRRRDMISGLRQVAKALDRPPQDVPCHGRWLQPRLTKISPAARGLSTKTWQNAVSNARSAMAHVGIVERRFNRVTDLAPEWQTLWTSLLATHDKTLQPPLCRFVHFLSNQGVSPQKVRNAHALCYLEAVTCNEISKSPQVSYRAAVNGWNLATDRVPDWPKTRLSLESRQKVIKLPEDAFPVSFIQDVDALMSDFATPDPLAEDGRHRALRPASIAQYRRQLIRFASEVVHSGVPIAQIQNLAVLLQPDIAERGLRQMLSRSSNQSNAVIAEIALRLRNFSRVSGQPAETQIGLDRLAKRLAVPPQRGMTKKNRDRLRVLQNDERMRRLLNMPDRLFTHPPKGKANAYTKALAREDAVAIAILLICPVRIKNLAGIHLERHIQRPGDGRAYLVLVDDEVKNERPLEFEFPKDLIRMIDQHLATRSPMMCPRGTQWLFPRRDVAAPVEPSQLSSRIAKRVRKQTGLEVNAHLFRHLAVMNWLDANPGGYEVARRLLGHSEVSRTISLYSGLEVKSATRAFADLIETKKGRNT
ncbi:tyrosine-type recombinase/integrase [Yoonia sediminilitoris]|uniref:Phage integrase family protein n=1 Tax=Yoonia sediminilitoris TaxID=1286148 RepID=A0A2T6K4S0_9RHOB|nr:tyrosine-type recombinase/integrase [Yoonia sediminilitoris]PUB09596.1 phage integrase family protein [Yoonia sediminilitoris]RCW89518.1 phage integrase family protein [Yoonia sediminilitoris]